MTVASHILFRLVTTLVVLLAVVAAGAACAGTAHAQQVDQSLPPLADLTITAEYNTRTTIWARWDVTVKNNAFGDHPGMQVHRVEVEITISDSVHGDTTSLWTIRDLPPGGSAKRTVNSLRTIPSATDEPAKVPQRLYARIIKSDPVELPSFRFNNATEHWAVVNRHKVGGSDGINRYAHGDVGVDVPRISDRLPPAAGATTFTVTAYNYTAYRAEVTPDLQDHTLFEVQVEISLSPGLSFAGTQPDAPEGTTFDTTTGIWNVGTLERVRYLNGPSLPVAVNLSADSLADLPLENRCLTAKVVRVKPSFITDWLNDTATACLGRAPLKGAHVPKPAGSGSTNLIDFYPCIGVTSYPCTSGDTLKLMAVGRQVVDAGDSVVETHYLEPESVFIHVPVPDGRTTKGGSVIWSTANIMDLRDSQTRLTSSWEIKESVTVTAPGGGDAPGRWLLTNTDDTPANNFDVLDAMGSSMVASEFFALSDIGTDPADYYLDVKVDFWALGTYKALLGISGRLSGTTYTDSGTYIFHVGPVADLAVRDAGANPEVAADRRAYTILAMNNGPELDVSPVRVTLTGVPKGAEADTSQGSYAEGDCQNGLCEGVWTIGNLRHGYAHAHRASVYGAEGPTLTLITASGGPITATIESMQNYCVRIKTADPDPENDLKCAAGSVPTGYTEHSVAYYDHVEGNKTTTVALRDGTGEGLTSAPKGVKVMETPVANILTWQPVEKLYGHAVTHYEVQRSDSPWMTLDSDVKGITYLDMAPGSDHPDYRVRAVNEFGVPGPWSESSGRRPGAPGSFTATGVSDAQAKLSWSAPAGVDGVSVTGYDLDFSTDGGNTWTALAEGRSARSYTHTDSTLASGTTRQYRVRAVGTSGSAQREVKSGWRFAVATRDYLTPGAPRNFVARPVNEARVDLSWSAPEAVSGVTHTGYHLDFSTDGNTWTGLPTGQTRPVLSATTLTHTHTDDTLLPGAIRQYRVRSVGTGAGNAVFQSPWVFSSATTEEVGAPLNLAAAADGRNRIDLTWDLPGFGADLITGYRIDYTPAAPEEWRTLESGHGTAPRQYEHAGLLPAERYCYRVAATYDGGTSPFSARACATTAGAPTDLPGPPENLRIDQLGRNHVTLEWDAPSVGGQAEYYEYRYNSGPAAAVSPPTATRVRVGGLQPGSHYQFQARAGNSHGPGEWSEPVQVTLHRAGAAARATPAELSLDPGGSGSFNIRLNRSPQWPLMVRFYAEGPNCLTTSLAGQQSKVLLPGSPPPSRAFWTDGWWGPPDDRWAAPWNAGLNFQVDASDCQGGETAVVEYDLYTLPFSQLADLSLWDELGLDEHEWQKKWGVDPLDGTSGPSVKVTVRDND